LPRRLPACSSIEIEQVQQASTKTSEHQKIQLVRFIPAALFSEERQRSQTTTLILNLVLCLLQLERSTAPRVRRSARGPRMPVWLNMSRHDLISSALAELEEFFSARHQRSMIRLRR
jgi:hypothetical protein